MGRSSLRNKQLSEPPQVCGGPPKARANPLFNTTQTGTPMWNDTDTPLALLITFRCYGTWLHGDMRGSVDKRNNIYGTPNIPENKAWLKRNMAELNHSPVTLSAEMRRSVEIAIKEACAIRNWALSALHPRTNHVHSVIRAGNVSSKKVLHALKANATRRMRDEGTWPYGHSPW